ncbi:MAG: hypothetical protein Q9168_005973 [Polycauliona sp. 1 TL-2023]
MSDPHNTKNRSIKYPIAATYAGSSIHKHATGCTDLQERDGKGFPRQLSNTVPQAANPQSYQAAGSRGTQNASLAEVRKKPVNNKYSWKATIGDKMHLPDVDTPQDDDSSDRPSLLDEAIKDFQERVAAAEALVRLSREAHGYKK